MRTKKYGKKSIKRKRNGTNTKRTKGTKTIKGGFWFGSPSVADKLKNLLKSAENITTEINGLDKEKLEKVKADVKTHADNIVTQMNNIQTKLAQTASSDLVARPAAESAAGSVTGSAAGSATGSAAGSATG